MGNELNNFTKSASRSNDILNKGIQTTDKALYFVAVESRDRMEIQFTPPSFKLSEQPGMNDVRIIGRSTPKYQYVSGGEVLLSLNLDFYAEENNRVTVTKRCNWLRSLRYPNKDGKVERVVLVFGDLFKKEVWVIKDIDVTYSDFSKANNFMPQQAAVSLQLALDVDYNIHTSDVIINYNEGAVDGSNPIDLGVVRSNDDTDTSIGVGNGNDFTSILRRATQNLRL